MSQDWESMKLELQDVVGNHRAASEPFKNDLWKQCRRQRTHRSYLGGANTKTVSSGNGIGPS